MRALGIAVLAVFALGCAAARPEVKHGTTSKIPKNVVLLPAQCSSVQNVCNQDYVLGVEGIVKKELIFLGYTIVDARELLAEKRTRQEISGDLKLFGEKYIDATVRSQNGSLFEDLPPAQKRALLEEAKSEGILKVLITIGANEGASPTRQNEVLVRLDSGDDDEMVWVSRCSVESGFNPQIDQALDKAAKCAISGVGRD